MTYKEIYEIIGAPNLDHPTITDKLNSDRNAMIAFIVLNNETVPPLGEIGDFVILANKCEEILRKKGLTTD